MDYRYSRTEPAEREKSFNFEASNALEKTESGKTRADFDETLLIQFLILGRSTVFFQRMHMVAAVFGGVLIWSAVTFHRFRFGVG